MHLRWETYTFLWSEWYKMDKINLWAATWGNVPSDTCVQQRLKSAFASLQSDQSTLHSYKETLHLWLPKIHLKKILIRLCKCAGWSESLLGAPFRRYFFRRCGSYACIQWNLCKRATFETEFSGWCGKDCLSYKGTCHVILLATKLHDMYLYKTTTFAHQPLKSTSKVAFLHRFHYMVSRSTWLPYLKALLARYFVLTLA